MNRRDEKKALIQLRSGKGLGGTTLDASNTRYADNDDDNNDDDDNGHDDDSGHDDDGDDDDDDGGDNDHDVVMHTHIFC